MIPDDSEQLDIIKQFLVDSGAEDAEVFENPSYARAFLGVSDEGRAVYSYDEMVQWLVVYEKMTEEEAREFIDYNTLRSLPYQKKPPIVLFTDLR